MTEQEKRERVVKGLECCVGIRNICFNNPECPYNDCEDVVCGDSCMSFMMRDAIALLKAQELAPTVDAEKKKFSNKIGKWIPLGHIIGSMNHPWSEYFKCSLCGYEHYTLFDLPPDECPNCKANMILEQEG